MFLYMYTTLFFSLSCAVVSLLSTVLYVLLFFFFFQAEDGIRDIGVTGVQTCALPISPARPGERPLARPVRAAAPAARPASDRARRRGAVALPGRQGHRSRQHPRLHRQIGRASCRERV